MYPSSGKEYLEVRLLYPDRKKVMRQNKGAPEALSPSSAAEG